MFRRTLQIEQIIGDRQYLLPYMDKKKYLKK